MPCSCLVKLQLLLMVIASLSSCLCFWCTCLLVEHGKLKKPWTRDKHYLAKTKMRVANSLLILKAKHSTVEDSRKIRKKIISIPAENISRYELTVCSLSFQQISLLLRLQTSNVNKEHTKSHRIMNLCNSFYLELTYAKHFLFLNIWAAPSY